MIIVRLSEIQQLKCIKGFAMLLVFSSIIIKGDAVFEQWDIIMYANIGHITDVTAIIFIQIMIVIKIPVFLFDRIRTESINGREDFVTNPRLHALERNKEF